MRTSQAAGDAASAAYLHPIAKSHQVGHILRAAANEARICEIDDPSNPDAAAGVIQRAQQRATPELIGILRRYPATPTANSPVSRWMTTLDAALRDSSAA
jgi:hypothetical protein